jgi:acetyl-CoA carboxylase carboxyl transferase subunit alpha
MRVIEEIVPEPLGGAHRNFGKMCMNLGEALDRHLRELDPLSADQLLDRRYKRFRHLGEFEGDTPMLLSDTSAVHIEEHPSAESNAA